MAAITSGIIAAGAAAASAKMSSSAIKTSGRLAKEAADAATVEQRRQAELSRADFAPFLEQGQAASGQLGAFLGLQGQEAEQAAIAGFNESPGQKFLRERQERSLVRNEAALGGLGGGNVRTALQEQAFGIASTQLGERKDRLANVASLGATSASNLGALGSRSSENIGNIAMQSAADQGANALGLANNRRSGLAAIGGAIAGEGGLLSQFGSRVKPPPKINTLVPDAVARGMGT
ncbi:MAG: hypothetical protein ACKVKT_03225 [Rhodospirillales bacterium]